MSQTDGNKTDTDRESNIRDPGFKGLVRDPNVLSNLLGEWIDELKDMEPEQIKQCLDIGVNGLVQSLDTRLFVGDTYYEFDNYFTIRTPDRNEISCFIDIEGQVSRHPGYDLHDRMTCYMARMVDEQVASLEKTAYRRIRKCYVIFIMLRPKKTDSNRIRRFAIMEKSEEDPRIGYYDGTFDKVEIVEVHIPDGSDDVAKGAMEILKLLFSDIEDKKAATDKLAKSYNIDIDKHVLGNMSNLDEEFREYYRFMADMEATAKCVDALMTKEGWSFDKAASLLDIPEDYIEDVEEALEELHKKRKQKSPDPLD